MLEYITGFEEPMGHNMLLTHTISRAQPEPAWPARNSECRRP